MSVSSEKLRSWTAVGARAAAQKTYTSIKNALNSSSRLTRFDYEVFLQGSYANATNIRGDSDVDIVAMLKSTFIPDTSRLSLTERQTYDQRRRTGTVKLSDFRSEVRKALTEYYGSGQVHGKDKCIRVDGSSGYVDADVVPCYQHRLYTSYPAYGQPVFIEGINIRPRSGGSIVNYPKEHKKNGRKKNGLCGDTYKPTVRQVKRLANHAASLGRFEKGTLPGYVLECMVYNVSRTQFIADDAQRVIEVMAWLSGMSADDYAARFKSCDEIHHLFQDDPGQHSEYTAKQVIDEMWEVL